MTPIGEDEQLMSPVFASSGAGAGLVRCTATTTKRVRCARPGTLYAEGRGVLCKQHYRFWCEGRLT